MRNQFKIEEVLHHHREQGGTRSSLSADTHYSYEDIVGAAFGKTSVAFDKQKVVRAYDYIKGIADSGKAVYGITTSFGGNIKNVISPKQTHRLQENLVISHVANVGSILPYEITRAALIIRALTLTKGYSGISPALANIMSQCVKAGIAPVVRAHGSMGASGDLSPLSAIAQTFIGRGEVFLPDGKTIVSTKEAFDQHGIEPITLMYRDGLALINGTGIMTAVSIFNLFLTRRIIENSLLISALTIEALHSSKAPFDPNLHKLKPHPEQIRVATVMNELLKASKLAQSADEVEHDVEADVPLDEETSVSKVDLQGGSYSLRAIPQIYQPILAHFEQLIRTINIEINAIDDNPIILTGKDDILHGANFHGHPISVSADALNLAMVSVANISTSRQDRMLKSHHTGLPAFLATGNEGLYLGMQGAQYMAAGITAELRALAAPLSVNQVTTNNDNQDLVSFGLQASLKGLEIAVLTAYVLAGEALFATQATWLRLKQLESSEKDLSSYTASLHKRLLSIYTPKESTEMSSTDITEQLCSLLLTEDLLPDKLRKKLWQV